MSRSHEPSYYEIALTNRQVLVAFSVLLACLVVAFLSGAWVGKDRGGPGKPSVAELAAAGDSSKALTELNFFSEESSNRDASPASGQVSPVIDEPVIDEADATPKRAAKPARSQDRSASASSTLVEDLGGKRPRSNDQGSDRRRERSVPLLEVIDRKPAAEAARTPATRPAIADGDLVIQVFTSAERAKADEVVKSLKSAGHQAFLAPFDVDGRTLFRVRIGPFSDRGSAEKIAAQVEKSHRLKPWITASQ